MMREILSMLLLLCVYVLATPELIIYSLGQAIYSLSVYWLDVHDRLEKDAVRFRSRSNGTPPADPSLWWPYFPLYLLLPGS